MSEVLKKLREEGKLNPRKEKPKKEYVWKETLPLKDVAEALTEATKREAFLKRELAKEKEEAYSSIKMILRDVLRDEAGGAERYRTLASLLRGVGNEAMARVMEDFAKDEERHFRELRILKLT